MLWEELGVGSFVGGRRGVQGNLVVAVEREAARKWGWARPPRLNTETLFTV
jgi:hypothetical protein